MSAIALSGHCVRRSECLLSGVKRTSRPALRWGLTPAAETQRRSDGLLVVCMLAIAQRFIAATLAAVIGTTPLRCHASRQSWCTLASRPVPVDRTVMSRPRARWARRIAGTARHDFSKHHLLGSPSKPSELGFEGIEGWPGIPFLEFIALRRVRYTFTASPSD